MSSLVDQISAAGLADRFLNHRQLAELLGGSGARRYGLVNRALKDGSLIRLKRGCYVLARRYRRDPVHPFAGAENPGQLYLFRNSTVVSWMDSGGGVCYGQCFTWTQKPGFFDARVRVLQLSSSGDQRLSVHDEC